MEIISYSPIDNKEIGRIQTIELNQIDEICYKSQNAFLSWRNKPAPSRGEFVRLWGEVLREKKQEIANLITLEAGKTISESLGEVQEMIDMPILPLAFHGNYMALQLRPKEKIITLLNAINQLAQF